VALLGRSNVGKSSLLNALAATRNLARVSARPGHTRLVNFYRVGNEMYLADLPGYGYARVPEAMRRGWEELVTSYLVGRAPLALGVFLVDLRHDPMDSDRTLRAFLDGQGLPYVVAAVKADTLGRGQAAARVGALRRDLARSALDVMAVSAKTGDGIPDLWRTIRAAAQRGRREN
jgi:GTP-binding protein